VKAGYSSLNSNRISLEYEESAATIHDIRWPEQSVVIYLKYFYFKNFLREAVLLCSELLK
jgi:hypothetical protein